MSITKTTADETIEKVKTDLMKLAVALEAETYGLHLAAIRMVGLQGKAKSTVTTLNQMTGFIKNLVTELENLQEKTDEA